MNINQILDEWTDLDFAMHVIAVQIGIINDEPSNFAKYKSLYWTVNDYSRFLNETIKRLIDFNILELNDNEDKVRKNPKYNSNTLLV